MIAAQPVDLDRLDDELRLAQEPARELLGKVVASAGARLLSLRRAGRAFQIDRLIEVGAWTDAAFALIELGTPSWKLRRLLQDDGGWFCSLSRQPNLPIGLDDTVEVSHAVLALAILRAFVHARRRSDGAPGMTSTVLQVPPLPDQILCCDDFA